MRIKRYYISVAILLCPLFISAQTIAGSEILDYVQLTITNNRSGASEKINLYLDNSTSDDWQDGDSPILGTNPDTELSTVTATGARLYTDQRPYNGRYSVDFPLHLKLNKGDTYTLTTWYTSAYNKAATIYRFIDYYNPNGEFVDLRAEDYTFSVSESGTYSNRFGIRIYAACLFKKDAVDSDWNKPDNWVSGLVPGKGDARINNCAIIPTEGKVSVPNGTQLTIGTLLDGGLVTIEEQGELTITQEAILSSFSEIY